MFKPENARDCVIGILCPSKTATGRITRYVCDGRMVLAGRQPANCILDNRPPSPGLRPVSKHVSSFDAVFQAGNKTFLSLRPIGCEQERKQMHAIHVFCEHSAKLEARRVRLRCLSRDRRSSWQGQLCPLCSCYSALMPKHFVAHVGPELFCHIEEGIQAYLLSPLVRGISKRSIHRRIVEVGDACGHRISASSDVLKWARPSSPRVISSRLIAYPVRFQNPPVPFTK